MSTKREAVRVASTNGEGDGAMANQTVSTAIEPHHTPPVKEARVIPLALTPVLARLWQRAEASGNVLVCGACGKRVTGVHAGRGRHVAEHPEHLYNDNCRHSLDWYPPRLAAREGVSHG